MTKLYVRRALAALVGRQQSTPTAAAHDQMQYDHDADGMRLWDKNLAALRDPRFVDAYERGIGSGVASIQFRAAVACWAARHALGIPGNFVECGVNEGWLALTICHFTEFGQTGRRFYLFDTFNGIPPEQISAREQPRAALHQYAECYERVRDKFASFPNVELVRGKVPATLTAVDTGPVSYLSIDMNIAKPEQEAVAFFWPKMSAGGLVLLDDYAFGGYEAQHETMDRFFAEVDTPILTLPTGQGLVIKR